MFPNQRVMVSPKMLEIHPCKMWFQCPEVTLTFPNAFKVLLAQSSLEQAVESVVYLVAADETMQGLQESTSNLPILFHIYPDNPQRDT